MNNRELKEEFCEYTKSLIKYNGKWEFSYDVLDSNKNTKMYFKDKFDKLLILLNENDSMILDKDTDDIYDMLESNIIKHEIFEII